MAEGDTGTQTADYSSTPTPVKSKQPSIFKPGQRAGGKVTIVTTKVKGSPPVAVATSQTVQQVKKGVRSGELIPTKEGIRRIPSSEQERIKRENEARVREYYTAKFQRSKEISQAKREGYEIIDVDKRGVPVSTYTQAPTKTTFRQRVKQKVFSIIPEFRTTLSKDEKYREKQALGLVTPAETKHYIAGKIYKGLILGAIGGGVHAGVGYIAPKVATGLSYVLGASAVISAPSVVKGFARSPFETALNIIPMAVGYGVGYKGSPFYKQRKTKVTQVREISPKTKTRIATTQPKTYFEKIKLKDGTHIYKLKETPTYSKVAQKQPSFIEITTKGRLKPQKFFIETKLKTTGTISKSIKVEGIKGRTGIFETGIDIKGIYQLKKGKFNLKTFKRGSPFLQPLKKVKAKGIAQTFVSLKPKITKGYTALDITMQQKRFLRKPITIRQTTVIKSLAQKTAKRQFDFSYTAKGLKAQKIKAFEISMPDISPTPKALKQYFKSTKGVLAGRGALIEQFKTTKQVGQLSVTDILSTSGSRAVPLRSLMKNIITVPKKFARARKIRSTVGRVTQPIGKKGQFQISQQILSTKTTPQTKIIQQQISPQIITKSIANVFARQIAKQTLVKPLIDFKTLITPQRIGALPKQLFAPQLKLGIKAKAKTREIQLQRLKMFEKQKQKIQPMTLQFQPQLTKEKTALALLSKLTPIQKQAVRQRLIQKSFFTPIGTPIVPIVPLISKVPPFLPFKTIGIPSHRFRPSKHKLQRQPTYKPSLLALEFNIRAKLKKKLLKGFIPRITGLEIRPIPI